MCWGYPESAHDHIHRSRHPAPVDLRARAPASPRGDRLHRRHRDRMVRFLPLFDRHRPGLRKAVLSAFRPMGRHARSLRHLCRRLRRAPGGRRDLRPLRRPHRPQIDADRHAAADGPRHRRGGDRADLSEHRHLGRGAPDRAALHPGRRRRRRVGRLGADVDGMGARRQVARADRILAAIRRALRPVPGQSCRARLQPDVGRQLPRLGLAHSVRAQPRAGRASASTSGSASWRRRCSPSCSPSRRSTARRCSP